MYTISNKVTRLVRLPQTMRLIRSIKSLSEEAEEARHKNILLAAYNVVKVITTVIFIIHYELIFQSTFRVCRVPCGSNARQGNLMNTLSTPRYILACYPDES